MNKANFQLAHDQQARRVRVMARLSMRAYQRELGGYKSHDLTRGLESTFYLVEKLRSLPAAQASTEAGELIDHIQMKIGMALLGVAMLLDIPAPSTKCSR